MESGEENESAVSQMDEENITALEKKSGPSWRDNDKYDNVDELILNEAVALAKLIKSEINNLSEDTSDGESGAEGTETNVSVNSHPHSNGNVNPCHSEEVISGTESNVYKYTTCNHKDNNASAVQQEQFGSVHSDSSNIVKSVEIPATSPTLVPLTNNAETCTASDRIGTTTECYVIMTQFVPLVSSGLYVVGCGNPGRPMIRAEDQPCQDDICSGMQHDDLCSQVHLSQNDKSQAYASMSENSLDQSFCSSHLKHDSTLDEEFFSCEESFTVHDMTLKDIGAMAGLECQTDDSDEQTLSLTSSDSEVIVSEDGKSTATPVVELSAKTSVNDTHQARPQTSSLNEAEANIVREECNECESERHQQNDSDVGKNIADRILDNDQPSAKPVASSCPGDVLVQTAGDVSKKSCGSLCESLMTDDQDSVTDAGYQASESSGQEDTGYEEGETDGMNAMMWNHPIIRQQRVQAVTDPGNRSAAFRQLCGSSRNLSDDNSGSVAAGVQEFNSTVKSCVSSEEFESKVTDVTASSETVQLVAAESAVIFKPGISGSEFSETLSCISINRDTSEANLDLDNVENLSRTNHPVSLYVELAQAEHGPNSVKQSIPSTQQEDFNETIESDIDDAEALMAKSRENIDPKLKENNVKSSHKNEEIQINRDELSSPDLACRNASEDCVTESTKNVQNKSNQENPVDLDSEVGLLQPVGVDIGQHCENHHMKSLGDDLVSDVTSGHSTPRSGSQCSSNPSDELLQLLDKITVSGYGMRTQLEMAYARQAIIHEVGSRVDQIRSNVIRDLQQELDLLKAENQKLIEKVASYRNNNKQNGQKVQHLEALINQLQTRSDQVQVTRQNDKDPERTVNVKDMNDVAVSTEMPSFSSASTQTWCSSRPESEVEFGKGLNTDLDLQFEMRTSTPSQMYWSAVSPRSEAKSPTIIQGSVEFEGDKPPKRMPSMVSLMIDKILHQMNNLADVSLSNSLNNSFCNHDNSLSSQHEEDATPEGPDRWRRLAVAPISTDPNILILQRSLAAASFENELLRVNAKNGDDTLSQQVQRLSGELEEYKIRLLKANEQVEILELKLSGDKVEMELLHDQIAALEKSLSTTQTENKGLKAQLDRLSAEPVAEDDRSKELELKLVSLLEENAELQKQLENTDAIKKDLEKDLDRKVEGSHENQSSVPQPPAGEQHSRNCSPKEVVITSEEYNHLQSAMNFLQKYVKEYSENNVISGSVTDGDEIDKKRETQQDNQINDSEAGKIIKDSGVVDDKTSGGGDEVAAPQATGNDNCVTGQNTEGSTEQNMSFPIYKADIEELKTHVFGWRRLYGNSSLPHISTSPHVAEPHASPFGGQNPPVDKLPGTPITDGFSMMKGTISKYGNINGSAQHVIPLSTNVTSSSAPGGSTLHDDIMKQSEMVLDIIKESGDIKEADIPPAVFHWQDVRNSIAHQLLNESHQKIETLPQCESLLSKPKEKKDAKLTSLLKELERYLKDKDNKEDTNDGQSKNAGEDSKSKLPDSIRILKKAVEQELGASVNITIQTSEDQPAKLNLSCTVSESSGLDSEKRIDAEQLEERKDINKRKEKYKEEFDRINAEYEELRRKRLALLVQAYTGKQDPRPLTSKANSTINDTPETSKALALAKAAVFKSRSADDVDITPERTFQFPRRIMENKSLSAEYLASQTRVQRDLFAMAQKESSLNTNDLDSSTCAVLPGGSLDVSSASGSLRSLLMSKPNALLSSRDNRTISAISQDSQLIKERIQAVREQLTKAEQKRGKSLDYVSRYCDYVDDLEDDEPVEDEYDEYSTFQSPTKLSAAVQNQKMYEEKQSPASSLINRTRPLRREIYPHKKSYEPSSAFWQRHYEGNEDSFRIQSTSLHDTDVQEVQPSRYTSECASNPILGQTLDDLEDEDYLKYPENRGNITTDSSECINDRIDPNISSASTKERLNRSIRELHDYYQGHDRSCRRQEHSKLDVKQDDRPEHIPDIKEPSTVSKPGEQRNQLRKCANFSNSSLDQRFCQQSRSRTNTNSLDLPADPCSFFKHKNSPKLVKKNEEDVNPRRKPSRNQERSNYSGPIENASWEERSISPEREQIPEYSIGVYRNQNNLNSKCAEKIKSSKSHNVHPELNCKHGSNKQSQVTHEKDSVATSEDQYQNYKYMTDEIPADRNPDDYYGLAKSANEDKTERKLLSDSVHVLDDCNCVDVNTSNQSGQGQERRNGASDTGRPNVGRVGAEAKYDRCYKLPDGKKKISESQKDMDHSYDQTSCIQEEEQYAASAEQVAQNVPQSQIPSSSQMMDKCDTASRRSEDDESVSTSDAELVVTKGGDILKRPRSTSPTHNILMPEELNLSSASQTKCQSLPALGAQQNLHDTTSRYCEAICNDILNSPYQKSLIKNQVKWTEPRRHFGLRDPKMKGVTWAEPASCSNNTQYLKQHDDTNGIPMSPETCQQSRGILKPGKSSMENKPNNVLTDEQRQYADDLIIQYTSSVEYDTKKDELQNMSDITSERDAGQRSDIVLEGMKKEKNYIVDDEKFVQEIIQKYANEYLNNDDQEITELMSKVSFLADVNQDSCGRSDVKLVIKDPCVADEIIQKYVQQKCPETNVLLINP